jgi:hypothetical protein
VTLPAHPERRGRSPRRTTLSLLRSRIGIVVALSTLGGLSLAGLLGYEVSSATATSSSAPTVGTIPASAISGGSLDTSKVPDFVPVVDHSGKVVGYIRKQDLFMQGGSGSGTGSASGPSAQNQANQVASAVAPVYGSDLTTVVGHMEPGVGFVPLGASPTGPTVTPTTISRSHS